MSLVRFPDGSVIDLPDAIADRIVQSQAEYAVMEQDALRDREILALAIFRNEVKSLRITIGTVLHPTIEKRCPMCDGRFPLRGECYAVWMPKAMGGECKPMHVGCFLGASQWTT